MSEMTSGLVEREHSRWLYENAVQLVKFDERHPELVTRGYIETELPPARAPLPAPPAKDTI